VPAGTIIMLDVAMPVPAGYELLGTVSVDMKLSGTATAAALTTTNGGGNDKGTKHVTMNLLRKQ
jgi:hypothetical protein